MKAKETDQRACNINAVGCAMLRKNLILHDATALPHSRPRADKVQKQGRTVDTHGANTRGAHMADKAWRRQSGPWRTHGGQMEGKVWRRGQSGLKGHKADT